MVHDTSILITRNIKSTSALRNWAISANIRLIEKPFIKFEAVLNLNIPTTDWIFFSSPSGLKLYLKYYEIKARKIAVFGDGTNDVLNRLGYVSDYMGDTLKTTREIGNDFFSHIGNDTVIFPLSQLSKHNISACGNKGQIIELITYNTILKDECLKNSPDIIIFTSPSNVDGYLLKNELRNDVKIVAFGETTGEHLKQFIEAGRILIPKSPKEKDLILLLSNLN